MFWVHFPAIILTVGARRCCFSQGGAVQQSIRGSSEGVGTWKAAKTNEELNCASELVAIRRTPPWFAFFNETGENDVHMFELQSTLPSIFTH